MPDNDSIPSLHPVATSEQRRAHGQELAMDAILSSALANTSLQLQQRPSRLPKVLLASVAVIALLATLAFVFFPKESAQQSGPQLMLRFSSSISNVKVTSKGESASMAVNGSVGWGDRLMVKPNSQAWFEYEDGTSILAFGDTEFLIQQDKDNEKSKVIELKSGSIQIEAKPQVDGAKIVVKTDDSQCSVLGTVFRVTKKQVGTELFVQEGKVAIALPDGSGELAVTKGKQVKSDGKSLSQVELEDLSADLIRGFRIVDVRDNSVIKSFEGIEGNFSFSRKEVPEQGINIQLVTHPSVTSVKVKDFLTGRHQEEKYLPFSLATDNLHIGKGQSALKLGKGVRKFEIVPKIAGRKPQAPVFLNIEFTK